MKLSLKDFREDASFQNPNYLNKNARDVVAIHSGKLGDIIYSLPFCILTGVNHLILNTYQDREKDPLRYFPFESAQFIAPLLINQPYLRKLSIVFHEQPLEHVSNIEGVDYILDHYRRAAWQRIGLYFNGFSLPCQPQPRSDIPAHLVEHFLSLVGFYPPQITPWLEIDTNPLKKQNHVVVSITRNWRTFSNSYWRLLLEKIDGPLLFVGLPSEYTVVRHIPDVSFYPVENALELARCISQARLFLGTVSFPYSLAEGLQVERGLEPCLKNLNVFPLSANGFCLPPRLRESELLLTKYLPKKVKTNHRLKSFFISKYEHLKWSLTPFNRHGWDFLKSNLANLVFSR